MSALDCFIDRAAIYFSHVVKLPPKPNEHLARLIMPPSECPIRPLCGSNVSKFFIHIFDLIKQRMNKTSDHGGSHHFCPFSCRLKSVSSWRRLKGSQCGTCDGNSASIVRPHVLDLQKFDPPMCVGDINLTEASRPTPTVDVSSSDYEQWT